MFLFFLILMAIGAVNVLTPQFIWRMRYGRTAAGTSEPNPSFLAASRLTGIAALIGASFVLMNGL